MQAQTIARRSIFFPLQAALTKYANTPVLKTVPKPSPAAHEVLIKVETFAANPTDVLHLDYLGPAGSIVGCDFVGTVVEAGANARRFAVGDRLVGAIHGGKYQNQGSAAEYLVVPEDLTWKVPSGMSSHEAVTFGVGFLTAAMVLHDQLKVPYLPAQVPGNPWFLVSGGATSVGMFMTQLARASGFRVIATASPSSFPLCKEYGAEHTVSYRDHPAALEEIKRVTGGGVSMGLDCVGGKANVRFAVDTFGPNGGHLISLLLGAKSHRSNVKLGEVLLYRYMGHAFTFIPIIAKYPAEPERRKIFAEFIASATDLIESQKIKGNPVEVGKGLTAMPEGWNRLRDKKVSGKKLVYDL